jgi:tetratricopeptide (TPR) repeat protein
MSLHFSGGHDEEYELAKEAEAMAAPLVGKDSDRYINALSHWGRALVDRGEFAEARKAYEAIYAHQRKKTDATNLVTFDYLNALALTRRMTGDGAGAEQLLREGIRLNEKTTHYVGRAFLAETKVILSACLLSRSEVEEAGKLAREAGQPLSDSAASDELKHQAAFQLGVVLLESGRVAEAEPVLRKAQELARAAWVGKRERGAVDEAYGRCLRKLGRK